MKICPLLAQGGYYPRSSSSEHQKCLKENCAWWCKDRCALVAIAEKSNTVSVAR